MAKLLYIMAAPKDHPHSIKIGRKFLESYADHHPNDKIDIIDLWHMQLPPYDSHTMKAKHNVLHGFHHAKAEAKAWEQAKIIFKQFNEADKYVLNVPMWNFDIPEPLKHYTDIISQPGLAFKITPQGTFKALVTGKPAILIYAGGEAFGLGAGSEALAVQKPYMKSWLQFIGFKDIKEVVAEHTLMSQGRQREEEAINEVVKIAATF